MSNSNIIFKLNDLHILFLFGTAYPEDAEPTVST